MEVHLRSPAGISLSQTDRFDTPYNHDIPEQFHKDLPNHWHVTAETEETAKVVRIGAVMAVTGPGEEMEIELLEHPGWFGARATGDFGTVEGWAQIEEGARGPEGYDGDGILCGTAADGERMQGG